MNRPALAWGILGTGHIATRFAEQLAGLGDRARLQAVGARDPAKAAAFARTHGAARSGDYDAVLADPAVDAVYIALLNRDHAHWSIAASRAGKRVLCEKPAALNAAELRSMLQAAREAGRLWVEAFAYRFHPRWSVVRKHLPTLGGPLVAHGCFSFFAGEPTKPRLLDAVGGGALLDVGCYPLSWLIGLLGPPDQLGCTGRLAASGVDLAAAATLRFPSGHVAQALCGCGAAMPQSAVISGPHGAIELSEPFRNAPGCLTRMHAGGAVRDLPWPDDGLQLYAREALAMGEAADQLEHPAMPWADSLHLAETIDELRAEVS
jgi:xylose dehydrogenase (NAD/NADP)